MTLYSFKLLTIFFIIAVAQLGAYLALKTTASTRSSLYLSLGNTFSAGIFLGAGLIHMMPDATEEFSLILETEFPITAFITALGFLFILFIEKVLIGRSYKLKERNTHESLSAYILLFILSIHSIITGVALGTEDKVAQSAIIAIAVLAHKGSAAFALVVDMMKNTLPIEMIKKLILLFSFMTPLGIFLGIFISDVLDGFGADLTIALFDSLAAGTFLYIAIMEILKEEFEELSYPLLKFLSAMLGLLLMALLALWL